MPLHDGAWPAGTPCWVDVQVDDLDRGQEFYSALFGWHVAGPDDPQYGGYRMATIDGRPVAGLAAEPGPAPSVWSTYFAVDDADGAAASISAAGGQLMMPVRDVGAMGRTAVATDVNGAAFGIWQPVRHTGIAIHGEPGTVTWNELHTTSFEAAKAFYRAVFGYDYDAMGDGTTLNYAVFRTPGVEAGVGGINDDSLMPRADVPDYWLVWFATADCDATAARAGGLGGAVLMPPATTPFGRMAVLQGAHGEVFGVIDMATTAGEAPAF